MNSLGERLKYLRGHTSRDKYAPKLDVSLTTIANYENGLRSPDATFLLKVLDIHNNISPCWLLTGEGPINRDADQLSTRTNKEFDLSLLETVIAAIEEHLASIDGYLPPAKKAKLIAIIYDLYAGKEEKKVDKAVVINLFELAA
ncbi:helix-turn-helix domain-containing protein [Desulfobulbus propionicus]